MNKYCFLGNYTEADEILVTMERYQEYYQDALDGIAQMEKTKQLILESKSLNSRELRLVQQGAIGWANYLELPPKRRPSLEMRVGYTNKELALEAVNAVHGGLFAVALAIIAWIISAIAKLFRGGGGGSSGGGGGGASGIPEASRKKAEVQIEAMKKRYEKEQADNKEVIERLERREVTSAKLKVLGLRGPVIKEEDIRKVLDNILSLALNVKKSLVTLSGIENFISFTDEKGKTKIKSFDKVDTFLSETITEFAYVQKSRSRIEDYGIKNFDGDVFVLPIIEDNVVLAVYYTETDGEKTVKALLVRETKQFEPCDVFIPSDPNKTAEFATFVQNLVYKDINNVITYIAHEVSGFEKHVKNIKDKVKELEKDRENNKEELAYHVKALKYLQFLIIFYGRFNSSVTDVTLSIFEGIMAPVRL